MEPDMELYIGPERRRSGGSDRAPDTTALVAGVLATIGITLLLVSFGGALGIDVAGGAPDGAMATEFGTWAFVAAVLGTFGGCVVGGLMSRRHGITSALSHGLATCAGAIVIGALLGVFGIVGLMGGAFAFTGEGGAAVTAIGWSGWALFVAVVSSFAVAVGGWVAGLALQPRRDSELRIEEHRFVRPQVHERHRSRERV